MFYFYRFSSCFLIYLKVKVGTLPAVLKMIENK